MTINWAVLCPGCFQDKGGATVCPHCGYDEALRRGPLVLPHRTLLQGQYLLGAVLGKPGGFGITYLAFDTRLETLVAIKEYLPRDLAGRETGTFTVSPHSQDDGQLFRFGLEQFLSEARTLAKFDHAHVVRVRNVFEENGTAYLVMDYYEGISLAQYLEKKGQLAEQTAVDIMMPILDGLREVHHKGFLHRDIKPQNIYITHDGRPILLDFGSARVAMGEHSNTLSVVLTPGYAPFEQYHRKGEQGPWTDIYACAAVLYQMLTGQIPPEAPERAEYDSLIAPKTLVPSLSAPLNQAIIDGLAVKARGRPQTARDFQERLRPPSPNLNPSTSTQTVTPPNPSGYAGFWRRFAAALIDGVVVLIINVLAYVAIAAGVVFSGFNEAIMSVSILVCAVNLQLNWLYFAGMESSGYQATPGKLAVGLKVTDLKGRRLSFARASGRFFGKIVSSLTLGIGFLMAGFTQRKQALHDKMAGCLVLDKAAPLLQATPTATGLTAPVWLGIGGVLALSGLLFVMGANNELRHQAEQAAAYTQEQELDQEQRAEQAEQARLIAQREAQAEQERQQQVQREYQAEQERLQAQREAQAERESSREEPSGDTKDADIRKAEQLAVNVVNRYFQAMGNDTEAALKLWTDPHSRSKLAKALANTESAELVSPPKFYDFVPGPKARVWVDVWVQAKSATPAQRWRGLMILELGTDRWLIAKNELVEVQ
ncbi:serine/threonine protein kinase [Methylovulum psychrotolerans]|uniref:Serine/threonine protein kinase n=1 Tax=Methylovulum psychrotolerans TaxID=1704499 RepID=A0A2S5CNA2_9GAMM|nr:RDD family protein [Methylovulum psychrotolerans]POZ52300.1 serine/threonine protein kinase [Methylovulum psychrotolerans]